MKASAGRRVLMLLENNPYPNDTRVRREACALRDAGYRVSVVSPNPPGRPWRETVDGVEAFRYPAPRPGNGLLGYLWEYGYSLMAAAALSLIVLFSRGFDIVHAHNPPDTFFVIGAFYRLFGKRFVFDHHDLSPEMYRARFPGENNRVLLRILLLLERLTYLTAQHVIATNHSYARIAIQRGGKRRDRVTVVRNGPDLDQFRVVPPDDELRRQAGTILGYLGQMGVQDGIDNLLRALLLLVEDFGHTDVHCVLVGTGEAKPGLEAYARRLGLEGYVTFTGRVPFPDLLRYLSSTDICLVPDPKNDFTDQSTMIKITEYMALSKPIVAFDLHEHRVTAGEAASYARANDELDFARSIARLIENPEERERMGSCGRRRLEEGLAWDHSAKALLRAYQALDAPTPAVGEQAWRQ